MKREIVYPGSFLGYEEEFLAGENAYVGDGSINSEAVGSPVLDFASHVASVDKFTRNVKIIQRGVIVYGVVSAVRQNNVLVVLKGAESSNGVFFVVHDSNASLAVFNIDNSYVNDIQEFYRVGDVIRARVVDVTPYGIEIDTKAPDLGVVKAYGIRSRKPLHLINGVLRDPTTGDFESRKVSTLYNENLR